MTCIYQQLEWCQFSSLCQPYLREPYLYRCVRFMGLWSHFFQPLAATTMVTSMGHHQHYGKGNGTHSGGLCCLGSSTITQEHGVPLLGLVAAINKGSLSDKTVMHLIRCLWFFTAVFNIRITATHIAGKANNAADMFSRNQSEKFLATFPHMPRSPTPLPTALLRLVSPSKLDWTSRQFKSLFRKTYHQVQNTLRR